MKKVYRLKNGYSITKEEIYDGYQTRSYWRIYKPDGNPYLGCGSYQEAYELASHLVNTEEE